MKKAYTDREDEMMLSATLKQEIIDFLASLPNIDSNEAQHALINRASLDPQLQSQIVYPGSTALFLSLLVDQLVRYGHLRDGRNALEAILEAAKTYIGEPKQEYCDELIQKVASSLEERASKKVKMSPAKQSNNLDISQIVANLMQIVCFIAVIIDRIWLQTNIIFQHVALVILVYIIYTLITVFFHFKYSRSLYWNLARWIGLVVLAAIFYLYPPITNLCDYYGFEIIEPDEGFILENGQIQIRGTLKKSPPYKSVRLMTIGKEDASESYWPQQSIRVKHNTKNWDGVIYSQYDVTAAIVVLGEDGQILFDYFGDVAENATRYGVGYHGLRQLTKDVQICKTVKVWQRTD